MTLNDVDEYLLTTYRSFSESTGVVERVVMRISMVASWT